MRRALKALPLLAALLALLPAETRAACADCLRAGAARVELAVPPGTPLAGYGDRARRLLLPDILGRHPHAFWFRPNEGALDPVAARALVLESGGQRLTWLSIDLIAVDSAFTARVARALGEAGLPPGAVIVSASHTHSGPGAFMESGLLAMVSVDRGDRGVRETLIGNVVQAARRAQASMGAARIGSASVTAPDLTIGRLGQAADREIVILKVASQTGTLIATVWNYAIHGTMLPAFNLRLSGDVMGVASRELERLTGAPALFVNGAVGDVSPARHGETESREVGRELAAAVHAGLQTATAVAPLPFVVTAARVDLPSPTLSIRNCTASWVPGWLRVPLGAALPRATELTAVRLGDVAWVTVPGELQSRLGRAVKRAGPPEIGRVLIAGVSNDYLGYFLTADDYRRVSYVACATLYGPEAGPLLTQSAEDLIRTLANNHPK